MVDLLTGDGMSTGVIPRLQNALNSLSGPEATLTTQKDNEQSKITRLQKDMETREKNAERRLEDLKGKLARTQAAMTKIQQQGAGFAGQAAAAGPQLG